MSLRGYFDEILTQSSCARVFSACQSFAAVSLEPGISPPGAPNVRAADTFFLDDEKIVWHWPDLGARLIEDLI